jgi:hypothetical protein
MVDAGDNYNDNNNIENTVKFYERKKNTYMNHEFIILLFENKINKVYFFRCLQYL